MAETHLFSLGSALPNRLDARPRPHSFAAPTTKEELVSTCKISVKELAERLEADPRELRKWLRAEGKGAGGKGKRYEFSSQQANALAKKWAESQEEAADAS